MYHSEACCILQVCQEKSVNKKLIVVLWDAVIFEMGFLYWFTIFEIILKEWHKAFILTWKSLLRTRNYYYFNMDLYLYENDSIFISTTYDFTD